MELRSMMCFGGMRRGGMRINSLSICGIPYLSFQVLLGVLPVCLAGF